MLCFKKMHISKHTEFGTGGTAYTQATLFEGWSDPGKKNFFLADVELKAFESSLESWILTLEKCENWGATHPGLICYPMFDISDRIEHLG